MRASPNPSGEQLVTDYLTRVAQQARHLPKGARMAFVGRTRALVERELGGPGALTDPGRVSAVLDRLGTPEDLVIQERTRIDRDWVKKRASSREEGEAAAAALAGPRNRSLTPRRRLNTSTQTGQRTSPDLPGTGPVTPVEGTPVPGYPGARRPGPRSTGPRSTSLRGVGPRDAGLRSVGPQSTGPHGGGLRSADSPGASPGRQDGTAPGTHRVSWHEMLANTRQLARDHLLETIAILLLGLGGLILWFPFWPIGAIVALFSRLWDVRDKSLAVAGPLLVMLAGSVLGALIIGGSDNVVVVYFHAIGVDFNILIRVGCVLTAAYLAWRVTQGPRPKAPPFQRITRS
jgi:hypothetical protein